MAGDHETEHPDEAEGGPVKTFLEHSRFRWVLIKSVVALLLGMLVCLFAANDVVRIIKWPLMHARIHYSAPTKSSQWVSARTISAIFSPHTRTATVADLGHEPFRGREVEPLVLAPTACSLAGHPDPNVAAEAQRAKIDFINLSPAGGFIVAFQSCVVWRSGAGVAVHFLLRRGVVFRR